MPLILPSTDSTLKIFQTIRAYLLAFETPSGESLSDDVGDRVWYNASAAPDLSGQYPHVSGRFINAQIQKVSARWRADLELMVYDRPRAKEAAAITIGDRIFGALLGYKEASAGFLMIGAITPPTSLAPVPPPGDRDLVQVRILAEVIAYPELLFQYAEPGS